MKILNCYLFSIFLSILPYLNGCAYIFKAPTIMNYDYFYILKYHYLEEESLVILEFATQDSFYSYCDVKVENTTVGDQHINKVSMLGRYADPKDWDDLKRKFRRIANGSYVYSFKSTTFRPKIDRILYLDKEGEHDIPFAGYSKNEFSDFK